MDERVLLVEDDASIRELTSAGLGRAGFRVDSAADGREALAGSTFRLRLPIVSKSLRGGDGGVSHASDDRGGTDEEGSP